MTSSGSSDASPRPAAPRTVLRLAPQDNVAVALRPLVQGERVALDDGFATIERAVALGHKIAVRAIAQGETIVKYNCPIGTATRAIAAGAYVHTHNVASGYLPTYTLPGAPHAGT